MKPRLDVAGCLVLLAALSSCAPPAPAPAPPPAPAPAPAPPPAPRALSVIDLESPAPAGSAQPDLAVDAQGRVLLSWIESGAETTTALRVARLGTDGAAWTALGMPHQGADILANWADTPRLGLGEDGSVALTWPRLQGQGSDGYDVVVQVTSDDGRAWTAPITPHRDGTATEHDFPTLHADPAGGLGIVWLDGRAHAASAGQDAHGASAGGAAQALMTATLASDGTLGPERVIDPRVCDCCATASVRAGADVIVAYRDRSETEVRDIGIARRVATDPSDRWTLAGGVAADGWTLAGCPVNGPALAAIGTRVALAWFTSPDSGPRVNVAFSGDGGATFGAPIAVDDGAPLGRVDVAMLPDGSALVVWIESAGEAAASLRARIVAAEGTMEASATIASVEAARASGFPRLAPTSRGVIVAWTAKDGDGSRVKLARLATE